MAAVPGTMLMPGVVSEQDDEEDEHCQEDEDTADSHGGDHRKRYAIHGAR